MTLELIISIANHSGNVIVWHQNVCSRLTSRVGIKGLLVNDKKQDKTSVLLANN